MGRTSKLRRRGVTELRSKLLGLAVLVFASSLPAQIVPSLATYTLKATPKTVAWGYYDAKATPVLRVKPELGGLYPTKRDII
jgi:hypothetical protein